MAELEIDWSKASAEAIVYGKDGKPVTRTDATQLAAENSHELFAQLQGPEVRTPTYHVPIERITEKVGHPTIHRAKVNLAGLEARELESERVRKEAEEAKQQRAAEAFLRLPAGQRVVSLEERVLALEVKIDKVLAVLETKPKSSRSKKTVDSAEL